MDVKLLPALRNDRSAVVS